jgi:hypothetical protein
MEPRLAANHYVSKSLKSKPNRGGAESSGNIVWWMGLYEDLIESRGIQDADI